MKAIKAYIALRESLEQQVDDLMRQRNEIRTVLDSLDSYFNIRRKHQGVLRSFRRLAGKAKAMGKQNGTHGEKAQEILGYVAAHPECKSIEVADGIGHTRASISWHLRRLIEQKQLRRIGHTTSSRYVAVGYNGNGNKTADPSLLKTAPKIGARPARYNNREYTMQLIPRGEPFTAPELCQKLRESGVKTNPSAVRSLVRRMLRKDLLSQPQKGSYLMTQN